jgi:succinate dehydrogenase / fumarate reductase, iron-sulfur subunit
MNIDGANTLACIKSIDETSEDVRVYPLPHLEVLKDLVPDLTHLYAQYSSIKPWLQLPLLRRVSAGKATRTGRGSTVLTNASCVRVAPRHVLATGGTAIATSGRRRRCSPIAGWWIPGERLDNLEDPFRLYRCHTIMNCVQSCPKGLNPAAAIAKTKAMMVVRQL